MRRKRKKRKVRRINYSKQLGRPMLRGAKALVLTGFGLSIIKLAKSGFE